MKNHFINLPFGKSNAKGIIYNNFDYCFDANSYEKLNQNDIPIIYNSLHKYILSLPQDIRPVTLSPDYAITSATCSAMGEKFMTNEIISDTVSKYTTPLKVIYLTSSPHLNELNYSSQHDFTKSILSNILGLNEMLYTNHNFIIPPENFTLLGLNDYNLQSNDIETLNNNNMTYFTLSQIEKKTIEDICEYIQETIGNDPVFIIFDMSVMSTVYAPGVLRFVDNDKNLDKQLDGLCENEIIHIFKSFGKMNIVGLDITGFNIHQNTSKKIYDATVNTSNLALMHLLQIKEKRINVFTDETKFLIFRPIERINENDLGWYILKGISIELEEKIIKKLELSVDNVELFSVNDNTKVYIALTTIAEQDKKSIDSTESIFDCVLIPEEKNKILFYLMTKQAAET
jgi:arginase family enzyme